MRPSTKDRIAKISLIIFGIIASVFIITSVIFIPGAWQTLLMLIGIFGGVLFFFWCLSRVWR